MVVVGDHMPACRQRVFLYLLERVVSPTDDAPGVSPVRRRKRCAVRPMK